MFRIGIGNDTHRLTEGRPLILGGVHVAAARGAEGHSDADALAHAIADAILGAICEGDLVFTFLTVTSNGKMPTAYSCYRV